MEDQTASRVLADATKRVCRGEIEQNLARNNFDLSVEDYIAQIDGKTAALFEAASVLAAHYSGASASDCQALAKFGLLAGRAFQIADDLLDISGQQEVAGKSLGTDLANGKLTLPIMKLREHLDDEQLQQLRLMFGNGFDVGAQVSERWPDAWQAAVDATNETLSEYLAEANKCLDCFPNSIYANVLRDITSFLGERDY